MKETLKLALDEIKRVKEICLREVGIGLCNEVVIAKLEEALAQPEQEPVAWKLVPTEPTDEMLKAMDECSTEGYDERLYAGHAASVYMAAVDVAPTPPNPEQEPVAWITQGGKGWLRWHKSYDDNKDSVPLYTTPPQRKPLTDEEIGAILEGVNAYGTRLYTFARAIEAKLKEKNT